MLLVILKAKRLLKLQKLQETNQFRVEKVIKRKGNKLYVKWKGYHSSFKELIGETQYK